MYEHYYYTMFSDIISAKEKKSERRNENQNKTKQNKTKQNKTKQEKKQAKSLFNDIKQSQRQRQDEF